MDNEKCLALCLRRNKTDRDENGSAAQGRMVCELVRCSQTSRDARRFAPFVREL
jgi:hypothetical protein